MNLSWKEEDIGRIGEERGRERAWGRGRRERKSDLCF